MSFIGKIKFLLKSVREYKKSAILSIVFIVAETAFECVIPYVMQSLINEMATMQNGLADKNEILMKVILYAAILIALAIGSFIAGITAGKISAKAACGFAKNLREDIFAKTTEFSFTNIDKFSSSSLITRQTMDISNIQMAFMMGIRVAVRAPIMFLFSFIMAVVLCPQLSWIFAITIPLIVIPSAIIVPLACQKFNRLFRIYDDLNETVEENIRGMRVVKTYAKEEYEKEKFHKASYQMAKGFRVVEQMLNATNPVIQCTMYISMVLFLFMGAKYVIDTAVVDGDTIIYGNLNVGGISALITYSAQVLSALMTVSMVLFFLIMSVPSINRVYEVLVEQPSIVNPENPLYEVGSGDVEFKNVSFKYRKTAKKYALSAIDLSIKEGETIGIIGGTGSSKSTLVNLISRFYDPSEGEVLLGGHSVREYDIQTLRNSVAMVLQKNILFSGTIKENLRWGNQNASDEEIVEACRIAQADSFIQGFEKKYDTFIEQGGTNVSGGQRQRLCIARALLKKPKVLILDDSTSAVDTKTDAFIRKGLKENLNGVTTIIIAQRISSVQDADKIVVMENGKIDGIGTHEDLLRENKIYQEVYEIQNRIGGK